MARIATWMVMLALVLMPLLDGGSGGVDLRKIRAIRQEKRSIPPQP